MIGWKTTIPAIRNAAIAATVLIGLSACNRDADEPFEEARRTAVEEEPEVAAPVAPLEPGETEREPRQLGEDSDELATERTAEEPGADAVASMMFPAPTPALRVRWQGDHQIRTGQRYSYELEVTNVSDAPLRDVTVYQSLPPDFEIVSSQPAPEGTEESAQAPAGTEGRTERSRESTERPREQPQQTQERAQQTQEPAQQTQERAQQAQERAQQTQERAQQTQERAQQTQEQDRSQQRGSSSTESSESRTAVWRLGTLDAEETRPIQVTALVRATDNVRPCVYADYEAGICPELTVVQAELSMAMEYVDGEGNAGEEFFACDDVYVRYALSNPGTAATEAVTVEQRLPEGVTTADGNDRIELQLDPIPPGETVRTQPVELRIEEPGRHATTARAVAGSVEATAQSVPLSTMRPSLSVSVDGPDREYIGQTVTYQVEIHNDSNAPAMDTVVRIPLLEEDRVTLSTQRFEREGGVLDLGRLDPDERRSFSIRVQPEETGEISARLSAEAYCAAEATASLATDVVGVAAAQLEMVDHADPVAVGETITYEISLLNEGTAADSEIRLTAQVPDGLEFVEAEGPTSVQATDGALEIETLSQLGPTEEATWKLTFRANEAGPKRFEIEMTSEAMRRPIRETEPTRVIEPSSSPPR